jgi:hypothetical protein
MDVVGPGGPRRRVGPIGAILALALATGGCGVDTAPPADGEVLAGGPTYPRFDHSMTWTGEELIVGGGAGGDPDDGLLVDDPLAWRPGDGFRSIAPPPGPVRTRQAAVWTGRELIVWSGTTRPFGVGEGLLASAAAYDPTSDTWRKLADSPAGLGKVRATGAVVDGLVAFGGGAAPDADDDARIALYHLGENRWSEVEAPGRVLAVAGDGQRGWVLWRDDDLSLHLGLLRVDDDGSVTIGDTTPDEVGGVWRTANLTVIEGRLVIWGTESDHSDLTLAASAPLDGDEPSGWERHRVDLLAGDGDPGLDGRATGWAVGSVLATLSAERDLVWVDPDEGTAVVRSLRGEESCALADGGRPRSTRG